MASRERHRLVIFLLLVVALGSGQSSDSQILNPTSEPVTAELNYSGTCSITRQRCSHPLRGSVFWDDSHFRPCDGDAVNLFFEDPSAKRLAHTCDGKNVRLLSKSCDDIYIQDMALGSDSTLFFTTGHSIRSVKTTEEAVTVKDLISGYRAIHLKGFHLGDSLDDIVKLSVKGTDCATIVHHNSTDVTCITGDPDVLSSPITSDCMHIEVRRGGSFDGIVSEIIAVAKSAAGYNKPVMYDMVVDPAGFEPLAIAVDRATDTVFWANRATKSIQFSQPDGTGLGTLTTDVSRVMNMQFDHTTHHLVFTEAKQGSVFRCAWPSLASSCDPEPVVVGLSMPRSLSIDEVHGWMFIVEASTRRILRASTSTLNDGPVSADKLVRVSQYPPDVQIGAVAVTAGNASINRNFDFNPRLFWSEINTETVKSATVHGTLSKPLSSIPKYTSSELLVWPTALVVSENQTSLYVAEYLGKIWEFGVDTNLARRVVLDQSGFSTSSQIKSWLWANAAAGVKRVQASLRLQI